MPIEIDFVVFSSMFLSPKRFKIYLYASVLTFYGCILSFCDPLEDQYNRDWNTELDRFIDDLPEEELDQMGQFVREQLQRHGISEEEFFEPNNQGQRSRFGWESLGIFIVASAAAYLIIKHSREIFEGARGFFCEIFQQSAEKVYAFLHVFY